MAIVESPDGERVGFVLHGRFRWASTLNVIASKSAAPLPGRPRRSVDHPWQPFEALSFVFGTEHPYLHGRPAAPGAHHIQPRYGLLRARSRHPGLVRRIAPVLEQRLERSVARGYPGELLLSFFRRHELVNDQTHSTSKYRPRCAAKNRLVPRFCTRT
jgi:hypothetical protein